MTAVKPFNDTVTVTQQLQALQREKGLLRARELWAIKRRFIDVGSNIILDGWEEVSRWNYHYWLGHRMRRLVWDRYSIGGAYDGVYQYATYRDCALSNLEEHYG